MPNELLADLEKEFRTYQGQKSRRVGGVERRVLQNLAMSVGEQWVWFERGTLNNRTPKKDERGRITEVNLVLDHIGPTQEEIEGRLTASSPEFSAFPDSRDADNLAKAEVVTMALRAGDDRLDEEYLRSQRWFWQMYGGVAIEHTPYRPNLNVEPTELIDDVGMPVWTHLPTGEEIPHGQYQQMVQTKQALPEHFKPATELKLVGDYVADVRGPLNVFCPNSIKTFEDLQPGQSVMFADIRLLSWAKKTWPRADFTDIVGQSDFKVLTTRVSETVSFVNTSLHDLIPVIQGAVTDDDPDMLLVIERYEPVSSDLPPGWSMEPGAETGPYFVVPKDERFANGGRYTVFSPEQGILRDGEIPYADGIPATDFHWSVSAANFWNPDWCTRLNGPQKSINVLWSQIRMMSNARIFDPILTDEALTPPESDSPRYWTKGIVDGVPQAARLGGDNIPSHWINQYDKLVQVFNRLSGKDDLFKEDKFPGQIRGTGAVQMLQDTMDTKWGPKLRRYYKQMGKVYHRRINRMKQFYPPIRTMRVVDDAGQVDVFRFHADDILRAGIDYHVTVEPSSILPETRRERFARMTEILSSPLAGLYTDQDTGQLDWKSIAAELEYGQFKGKEAQIVRDEKFARGVLEAIKEGRPVPPVIGVEDHATFLRIFRDEMNDEDFWGVLSPETRQAIFDRYGQHGDAMAQAQKRQQQALIDENTLDVIRQAVQQSLARFGAEMTDTFIANMRNLGQGDPETLQGLLSPRTPEEEVF